MAVSRAFTLKETAMYTTGARVTVASKKVFQNTDDPIIDRVKYSQANGPKCSGANQKFQLKFINIGEQFSLYLKKMQSQSVLG
jgi:hypothetical protein